MPSKPAPKRKAAAPELADAALERVRAICLGFPGAEEKLSHGAPSYLVRGKMFLTFVDDHHGDGRLAVWCKSETGEQKRLVASAPGRFFVPPYVGVRGWVGVRLDQPDTDWIGLAMLVEEAWVSIAPKSLASAPRDPSAKRPPLPALPRTDRALARAALEKLAAICLRLPEAAQEIEGRHATFRVGKKPFVYFLDNHHGDGIFGACVKVPQSKVRAMAACDRDRFFVPAYIGPRGWLGVRLDSRRPDWKDLADRVVESYLTAAPKRLHAAARPPERPRARPARRGPGPAR